MVAKIILKKNPAQCFSLVPLHLSPMGRTHLNVNGKDSVYSNELGRDPSAHLPRPLTLHPQEKLLLTLLGGRGRH